MDKDKKQIQAGSVIYDPETGELYDADSRGWGQWVLCAIVCVILAATIWFMPEKSSLNIITPWG